MYKITNTEGRSGRVWSGEYRTKHDAAHAIADAMGWLDVAISDVFEADGANCWCCYETSEQRDADSEGSYAPRIVEELASIDPDAECKEHGCARWRCDADHEVSQ